MDYEARHAFRNKIIALCRKRDPKVKIDTKEFSLGIYFKRKEYLSSLQLATDIVRDMVKLPGVVEAEFDKKDDTGLQFKAGDLCLTVQIDRKGVFVFLAKD